MSRTRSRHRRWLLAAAVPAMAALLFWAQDPAPERSAAETAASIAAVPRAPATTQDHVGTEYATPAAASSPRQDALQGLRERLARSSLRGSQPDGEIEFDADGRLLPGPGLLRRFDYYLSLLGEFELAEIRSLLQAELMAELGDAAKVDAVMLRFERYLGLRDEAQGLAAIGNLAERLDALSQLRRRWFGAEAEALWADEEAYDNLTLARLTLAQLPESERETTLRELEAARPPALTAAQALAETALTAEAFERSMDERGLSEAERQAERRAAWGEAAAQRLQVLDAERAQWQQRLEHYARGRVAIDADPGLDARQREAALQRLLQGFEPHEQRRLLALEQAGLLPTGG